MKLQNLIHILIGIVCIGLLPGAKAVFPGPDGGLPGHNTAVGQSALSDLTTGLFNTAVGYAALHDNSTANNNTAIGYTALSSNTTGHGNAATGAAALFLNTTGSTNTATGSFALFQNTSGDLNTACGGGALSNNKRGEQNTATGALALAANNANNNTGDGFAALENNTTGTGNTATGAIALANNNGNNNTAVGFRALLNITNGSNNIALGANAGINLTTGNNNIDIGSVGGAAESNTIRIGNAQTRTFIRGISGAVVSGAAVVVNAGGQLGVAPSSARFKDEIRPMDKESEAILALKPVTFRYKRGIDPQAIPQFGLVAEEVAKVNPDLVVRGENGEIYTVRYDAVNAMLLNEFLKEHRKNEEQQATITELKSTVAQQQKDFQATAARQQKQIEAVTAGLQKVSAQLEASKPTPQVVNNP